MLSGFYFSPPPGTSKLLVGQTRIDFRLAEAFLKDLYQSANLQVPENFNPVIEIVRIVCTLKGEPEKIPVILDELKQSGIIT